MKRASMLDVAKKAGVSKATVSHVINGTRFVEEETKQRVLEAIKDFGYRRNALARSLATQRTGIIGIVVSDTSNAFFGEVLKGVEDVLMPIGYGLIVCNTNEILERESHYLDLLIAQRVDGIIAAATSQQWAALSEAERQHTPIVFLDRAYDYLGGPYVGVNNRAGAYQGVRHLIQCGNKAIGILSGFDRLSSMRERRDGYLLALKEAGLTVRDEWVIPSNLSVEGGQSAIRKILSLPEQPTAIFANNNLLSLGALLALREAGLHCPEDLALVGFDDHPWAEVSDPPLTVIRQPARQLGRVASEMLVTIIKGEELLQTRVILDCELVVRRSCRRL